MIIGKNDNDGDDGGADDDTENDDNETAHAGDNDGKDNGDDDVTVRKSYVILTILTSANITNSMDIYLLIGLLSEIQVYFDLSYELLSLSQGFLTGGFILAYPIFLLLEDRWSGKWVAVLGMVIKTVGILSSSFIPPTGYIFFLFLRLLSGMGMACQTSVTPRLIENSVNRNAQTLGLALFYASIPIGNGLGIILGTLAGKLTGDWRNSLTITPGFTLVISILTIALLGRKEKDNLESGLKMIHNTTIGDLKKLAVHQSYLLTTLGFMCSLFVSGASGMWGLFFINKCSIVNQINVSFMVNAIIFGLVLITSGLTGTTFALWLMYKLKKFKGRAGIFVSSCAMATGVPVFINFAMVENYYIKWPLLFICFICLYMTRALIAEIMAFVVNPNILSLAWSVQHLLCHSWGEAMGAFLVGLSMDKEVPNISGKVEDRECLTLQNTLFVTSFGFVIGAVAYFIGGLFYKPLTLTII